MEIFYAACAGLITVAVVVAAIYVVLTLMQIRDTARAIEYLAINANDRIESTRALFNAVDAVTGTLRSGWVRIFQLGMSLVSGMRKSEPVEGCRKF